MEVFFNGIQDRELHIDFKIISYLKKMKISSRLDVYNVSRHRLATTCSHARNGHMWNGTWNRYTVHNNRVICAAYSIEEIKSLQNATGTTGWPWCMRFLGLYFGAICSL